MTNKNPKVSILVPIYNVEKYLEECLNSIIKQTLQEIEIICINDGSTDNSLTIIQNYMKHDKRIKLINKNNTGYGDSMNQGLKEAQGYYIGIVESDDIIKQKMFKKLYKLAKLNHFPDIIKSNYYDYWSDENSKRINFNLPKSSFKVFKPSKKQKIFLSLPSIWSGIYKKSFLVKNNILFNPTPGASYQDTGFYFKTLALANNMICTNKAYLLYRRDNENSSVNNKEKVFCISDEFNSIEVFLNKHHLDKLKPLKNSIKFNTYVRNYKRISKPFKPGFLDFFRNEFLNELQHKQIQKKYFSKKSWELLEGLLESTSAFKSKLNDQQLQYLIPHCIHIENKLNMYPKKQIILYGYNDLAQKLIERNQWENIEIIDKNKHGTYHMKIPISRINDINLKNKLIIITALNPLFIKEIKSTILQSYQKSEIITV